MMKSQLYSFSLAFVFEGTASCDFEPHTHLSAAVGQLHWRMGKPTV